MHALPTRGYTHMEDRACKSCGEPLPVSAQSWHRFCTTACYREWHRVLRRAQVIAVKLNRLCSSCGEPISVARRKDAEHCSDMCKSLARTHRRYGMTWQELMTLREQNGTCGICDTDAWGSRGPNIDHDHKTGRIRGVLCSSCNTGLGCFQDDPTRLRSAADYLER